jgi:hypothetical protein
MGSGEVLEISSERDEDAYCCRHCPVPYPPIAKSHQHFTALPVKHISQKG